MRTRLLVWSTVAFALASLPSLVQAHFLLLEPVPTLVQNALGDPQKLGPRDHLSPRSLPCGAGRELAVRVAGQPRSVDARHTSWSMVGGGADSEPRSGAGTRGRSLSAYRPSDRTAADRRPDPQYHVQEVHAAGDAVHGRTWRQPRWRLLLPSLRPPRDHGRPGQAARHALAGAADAITGPSQGPRPKAKRPRPKAQGPRPKAQSLRLGRRPKA
jgi:hypothetical protein